MTTVLTNEAVEATTVVFSVDQDHTAQNVKPDLVIQSIEPCVSQHSLLKLL